MSIGRRRFTPRGLQHASPITCLNLLVHIGIAATLLFGFAQPRLHAQPAAAADVIVVGAGIAGLAAALEAARGGADVQILDMWSVFGGHAVMSGGGVAIVGTDYQRREGVTDTPELAARDFLQWGEDPDLEWVQYYANNSAQEIGSWLEALGVTWGALRQMPGNSVPRFHESNGRGLGLVTPIYRETLRYPNVSFRWNFRVTELLIEEGRVAGVNGEDTRSGVHAEIRADRVVLATGGFQSNLAMVLLHWPDELPAPGRLLVGSGLNSIGLGHELAQQADAAFHRMDHQWNYAYGLPHPRYPGEERALNAAVADAIWVNAAGERFVNEQGSTKEVFPAVVRQVPATYWAIFDEDGAATFFASGSGWDDAERIRREILENPDIVIRADTIEALAAAAGIDGRSLSGTIARFNSMVSAGVDADFGRFDGGVALPAAKKIDQPPFHAAQFFPMTRKSMGGVSIDRNGRVLDLAGELVAGLYAAGELTGFAGVNGSAGLEGTFLGPSVLTGRVAARTVLEDIAETRALASVRAGAIESPPAPPRVFSMPERSACESCHALPALVGEAREGYGHFERVHGEVLERGLDCGLCHAELTPFDSQSHAIDRMAQIDNCQNCHLAIEYPEP